MKTIISRLALLTVSTLALAQARGALNPAIVGADSQWVVYADLNALRASTIGKELISVTETAQFPVADGKVRIDVEKVIATVGTITAYGSNFTKDPKRVDGSLIVQGTPNLKKIALGVLTEATGTSPKSVTEVTDLPFEAYAVAAGGGPAKGQVFIGFPPEDVILVSKSEAQLVRALAVLEGKAPSLADNSSSPLNGLIPNGAGATVFAASLVPSDQQIPGDGPQARLLRMAHSGSVALGDDGPKTFAHVELLASSDEMAAKLMKILEGMTAMMSLTETNDQQLNEFLNSAAVSRQGNTVSLALSYSSARLAQMIQDAVKSQGPRNPLQRAARNAVGTVIAEWPTQPAVVAGSPAPQAAFVWRTVDAVHLVNGTTIGLSAARLGPGKGASFDRIEILPADGQGQPLVFRPEYMKPLIGFRIEEAPAGSGVHGKVAVGQNGFGLVRFEFPGEDGTYRIRVRYLAAPDVNATLTLGVKDPEAPAEPPANADAGHTDTK